jgi:hypothetical protein
LRDAVDLKAGYRRQAKRPVRKKWPLREVTLVDGLAGNFLLWTFKKFELLHL